MRISITAATCRGWSARAFAAASSARRARGPVHARAAGLGAHSGRGCAAGQQAPLLEALPALAALHRDRRRARADRLQPVGYDRPVPVVPGVPDIEVEFINAGPSARLRLRARHGSADKTILFGGDLGRYGRPVLPDPTPVTEADILLVESTYGDRLHERDDDGERLARIVIDVAAPRRTVDHSGVCHRPRRRGAVLAEAARRRAPHSRAAGVRRQPDGGSARCSSTPAGLRSSTRKSVRRSRAVTAFYTSRMVTVASVQQSKELVASRRAGDRDRVERHGDRRPRAASSGGGAARSAATRCCSSAFRPPGTRGRVLCDGAKQVKMHGQFVPVAARIEKIDSMSAHADAGEIMRWLSGFVRPPSMTYLVHGEAGPASGARRPHHRRDGSGRCTSPGTWNGSS